MNRDHLLEILRRYGLGNRQAYLDKALSRNLGLLTRPEQERLADATVAIPGMGGVGGVHLVTLVRTGVGKFHLADFDVYEPANVNRQFGARVPDFGRPKLEVMKEHALSINPYLQIKEFPQGIDSENMDDFLDGVDVVVDSLDFFCFDIRRLLFNRAREKGIYVVTAGPMGFSSAMLVFSPNEGMGFDDYFNVSDEMPPADKYLSYAIGLSPRPTHIKYMDLSTVDLESKAGPSLNIACQICSGMAATEAVRIILKKGRVKAVPHYSQFDPYLRKYRNGRLLMGNRNPIQRVKLKIVKFILKITKKKLKVLPPQIPCLSQPPGDAIPDEVFRYIIKAGLQAPSGDNVQPWKFSYDSRAIFLSLDAEADQSFFNVRQLASVISCGAVLENMRIAATTFGFTSKITYLPSSLNHQPVASLELIPRETQIDPLRDAIWQRNTNRKFYARKAVDQSVLHDLRDSLLDFAGVTLHMVTDPASRRKAARLVYKADRIRTECRSLHEYLYKMIRFSDNEARERGDGFHLKNLEAGFAGEMFLRTARPWFLMNIINTVGLGRMVALQSYRGIIRSSAVCLLTVPGTTTDDFLRGGQALERLWLTISRKGLAMQPMTAVTLFWLRWHLEGEESFMKKHRKLLRRVWEDYRTLFPKMDVAAEWPVMLFRVGYARDIKYGTLRKELTDFLP